MANALNVTITDDVKAVPVYIVGGGGGSGDVRKLAFREEVDEEEGTYVLTNAAAVLDALEDVATSDFPEDAIASYSCAWSRSGTSATPLWGSGYISLQIGENDAISVTFVDWNYGVMPWIWAMSDGTDVTFYADSTEVSRSDIGSDGNMVVNVSGIQ